MDNSNNMFINWDEQSDNGLLGSLFQGSSNLNDKIAASASNTMKEKNSFNEISKGYASESAFGKKSLFAPPQYISDNIDFVELANLILRNKDTEFNYEYYIGHSTRTITTRIFNDPEGARMDRISGNPSSVTTTETVEVEIPLRVKDNETQVIRPLQLKAKLCTNIADVNIVKSLEYDYTAGVEFEFDLESKKAIYKLHYYFVGKQRVYERSNNDQNIAFTVSSESYEDFLSFMKYCKISAEQEFRDLIEKKFLEAIAKMSVKSKDTVLFHPELEQLDDMKMNSLNWLYERIPLFVARKLDFDTTIFNVFRLSRWDKMSSTDDSTEAITTILKFIDPEKTYNYFHKNPQKLINLYDGFQGEAVFEQFCLFLTGITFFYAKPDVVNARRFGVGGDAHIETNILAGDDEGKVELVNELQLPTVGFDWLSVLNLVPDIEINNPNKKSNQFHPLDIIFITNYDELTQQTVEMPTIALYGKYLGDKKEWEDVVKIVYATFDVINIIFGEILLIEGAKGIMRLLTISDISISLINLTLLDDQLKNKLSKTPAGKWFVTYWPIINLCVGVGTISYYLAKGIVKFGPEVRKEIETDKALANQIDEVVKESKKVVEAGKQIESAGDITKSFFHNVSIAFKKEKALGKLYGQSKEYTCVASSLKMALDDLGIVKYESDLANALKTTKEGASILDIPSALKTAYVDDIKLIVRGRKKDNVTLDTLEKLLRKGDKKAVVAVRSEEFGSHAIVVDKIEKGRVFVRDPLPIEMGSSYSVSVKDFKKVFNRKFVTLKK